MIDSDVSTSLAEELSSSYLWQSTAFSECNVDHPHEAHFPFRRGSIREHPRLSYHLLPGD